MKKMKPEQGTLLVNKQGYCSIVIGGEKELIRIQKIIKTILNVNKTKPCFAELVFYPYGEVLFSYDFDDLLEDTTKVVTAPPSFVVEMGNAIYVHEHPENNNGIGQ